MVRMGLVRFGVLWCLVVSCLRADETIGPFLESEAPFLNSALVVPAADGSFDPIRRGVLVPLGEDKWACFDTDLLRWAVVWQAPNDEPPLSYDSMAAVSYPHAKAKAKSPPLLQGKVISQAPELPGGGIGTKEQPDSRPSLRFGGEGKVGPFPSDRGRWLGLSLRGRTPVLQYRLGDATISEVLRLANGKLERLVEISEHRETVYLRLDHGLGGPKSELLVLEPNDSPRTVILSKKGTSKGSPLPLRAAQPIFAKPMTVENAEPMVQGNYEVTPLTMPPGSRFVRPTDLAFLSDGTGLLTTLDGDVWRIENPGGQTSRWTRVAHGLFETISLTVTPDDRVFTLGRDQITELRDLNGDAYYDLYRNASNAFQQTLQTRDYATSLEIDAEGSFYLAKGGINKNEDKKDNELSLHRGTILKISPDGDTVTTLADGLRLPYVGLRSDGAVFASDQQGNFVPSSPIHLIADGPSLGFSPTNHREQTITEPLFYYPYQTNRSAAAFTEWNGTFLQLSWDGRLFGIETPAEGQAFSWQLPIQLDFPVLNGAEHPKTGQLYVTGLGISGYKPTTPDLSGIAAIREIRDFPKPRSLRIEKEAIKVTFDRDVKEEVTMADPALRLFNVVRSERYGSGHFRWDGEPGEERLDAKSLARADAGKAISLSFPPLFQADILDLHLTLSGEENTTSLHLFARPSHLAEAQEEDLIRDPDSKPKVEPGDSTRGKTVFLTYGCAGCHSLDGAKLVGPTMQGIGSRADEASLRESILEPAAVITPGYEPSMPSFKGVLSDQQLADLVTYLETL